MRKFVYLYLLYIYKTVHQEKIVYTVEFDEYFIQL